MLCSNLQAKLKAPKSHFNLKLSNILLTYRKMIHPATGQSPSMMMFGRQIRSRLDLMLPRNTEELSPVSALRELANGDRVRVRDFLSSSKWQFGRITSRLRRLRYIVKLDDGRSWERHVDHIVAVGSELPAANNQTTDFETHRFLPDSTTVAVPATAVPQNQDTVGEEQATPGTSSSLARKGSLQAPTDQPIEPVSPSVTSEPKCENVNPTLRRSTRIVRAPQRLNL